MVSMFHRDTQAAHRLLHLTAGGRDLAHPLRVARAVQAAGGSPDAVALALVHDLVEDGLAPLLDVLDALVQAGASDPRRLLDGVTRTPGQTYAQFIDHAATHPVTRLVKRCDVLDNLDGATPSLAKRYRKALQKLA